MDERLILTKKGLPSVILDGQALHSRYDPVLEAERFVAELAPSKASYLVIIEPALGYLLQPLRQRFPEARLIVLHCSSFYASHDKGADAYWEPSSPLPLSLFLEQRIAPGSECGVVQWLPSLRAYKERAHRLLRATLDFLSREGANRRTLQAFGLRWLRNSFRNIGYCTSALGIRGGNQPIVVCAAGPSLEKAFPALRKARSYTYILAASSAYESLSTQGIIPDLVLASDGGNWAKLHIHAQNRSLNETHNAFTLNAAVPGDRAAKQVLWLADESHWQYYLLTQAGLPFLRIPQRGTIAATAIDVALQLSTGPIYIAGFDMGSQELRSHVRPYAFDVLLEHKAQRLNPIYSEYYNQVQVNKANLDVYAAWFKDRLPLYTPRLRVLGFAHEVFSPLPHHNHIEDYGMERISSYTVPAASGSTAVQALIQKVAMASDPILISELTELVSPGSSHNELRARLEEIRGGLDGY